MLPLPGTQKCTLKLTSYKILCILYATYTRLGWTYDLVRVLDRCGMNCGKPQPETAGATPGWGRGVGIWLLALFCVVLRPAAAAAATVYFYSPETNINNFSLLKTEFDTYLSQRGRYQLQPFRKQADFEKFVTGRHDGVLLVSSWHYRSLKAGLALEPALVGAIRKQTTQTRALSVRKHIASLTSLKGQKIASAGSKDYTMTILRGMLGAEDEKLVKSFKVLVVPKDIDALMAVSFGMAKAALTTESSLAKLQKINKKQHGMLRQLATSAGTLLPIAAVPKKSGADLDGLLAVLEAMGSTSEGKKCLKVIGLDGLQKLGDPERKLLER